MLLTKFTGGETYCCLEARCVEMFYDPMDYSLQGSCDHEIFQARYWSGLPFTFPGELPDPGIEPMSAALQAYSLPLSLGETDKES